jgi:hypothetical protein
LDAARDKRKPDVASVGVPISVKEFRQLVADYLDRMGANDEFGADDYVAMTRAFNTIEKLHLAASDDLYQRFRQTYFPGYVQRASLALHALPTKGMALYSRERDIFIGGPVHQGSQYHLTDARHGT